MTHAEKLQIYDEMLEARAIAVEAVRILEAGDALQLSRNGPPDYLVCDLDGKRRYINLRHGTEWVVTDEALIGKLFIKDMVIIKCPYRSPRLVLEPAVQGDK